MRNRILVASSALALAASVAGAQVQGNFSVSDPPPLLDGVTKAKIVYTVSHLTTGISPDRVAFCVACTSTEKTGGKELKWGLEVIDYGIQRENDVTLGEGVETLDPGQTKVICTRSVDYFIAEDTIGDPQVDIGSARVLAERPNLICSAYSLDPAGRQPAHFAALPMFKGTKQRGN